MGGGQFIAMFQGFVLIWSKIEAQKMQILGLEPIFVAWLPVPRRVVVAWLPVLAGSFAG